MKRIIFVAVCALLLFGVAWFTGLVTFTEKKHHHIVSEFQVTHPWRETLTIDKSYVAQINASQHIELRSFEKGYLQHIYVDEGQMVHQEQKMFQLMPMLLEAEYREAKAEYDVAQIEYQNTSTLAAKKVVSASELSLAQAKLAKEKAHMELAATHLELSTVKAPFTGIMDRFEVRLGSLVEEGELLTTLSDNTNMWMYFNVSEADYLDYMQYQQANKAVEVGLQLANGSMFEHKGKIDTVEADFNNNTGNIAFRASFPNPDGLLRHGETGNVVLSDTLENALVIPQKASFEILDKKFVYVIDKDSKIQSRQVTLGEEVPHLFVVKEGLQEDDTILLEGLGKVTVGQSIKTTYQKTEAVKATFELPVN
jgi:membrane fusion protein, multidrug efflux system